jgi:hypothetical protein
VWKGNKATNLEKEAEWGEREKREGKATREERKGRSVIDAVVNQVSNLEIKLGTTVAVTWTVVTQTSWGIFKRSHIIAFLTTTAAHGKRSRSCLNLHVLG